MKKFLSIILAMFMILQTAAVFADSSESAETERVLRLVKSRIADTESFDKFESSVYENGGKVYSFRWHTENGGDYKSIDVSANEKGVIFNYSNYDSGDEKRISRNGGSINRIPTGEALSKAKELLAALNPDLKENLIVCRRGQIEALYDNSFSFSVKRFENGYEVFGDDGYIMLNGNADKITDFYLDYNNSVKFEAPKGIIGGSEAKTAYAEKMGLTLVYKKYYNDKELTIKPVYTVLGQDNKYINAESGEVIEVIPALSVYRESGGMGAGDESAAMKTKQASLSKAEISELDNISGLLSKEKIISLLKSNKYFALEANDSLRSYSVYKDYLTDDYYANISFENKKDDSYPNYTVDARSGEIISYNRYSKEDGKEGAKISADKLKETASEAAKNAAGSKFSEYELCENSKGGSFTFNRKVNGVIVDGDDIYISIDEVSGNITNYRIEYTKAEFPDVSGVIDAKAAVEKLFENVEYSPVYVLGASSEEAREADKAVLVYKTDNSKPTDIDAQTGKLLDYNGEEYKEFKIPEYTDLDGHYAKEAVFSLAKYGIVLDGENFNPNEKITQQDFLKILLSTFTGISTYNQTDKDYIYRRAKQMGIIRQDEINPEKTVKRGEAAQFIIRALGIEEYANLDGVFKCEFSDVKENIGAISILTGMKVLSGTGFGKFNPDGEISRADSMMIMYKYLTRKQ